MPARPRGPERRQFTPLPAGKGRGAGLSGPLSQRERGSRAFTLIELLVVITTIVVLLALLTPALDKAIYHAELTVCGAKLKAQGGAVVQYAMNHGRTYPPHTGIPGGADMRPDWLRFHTVGGSNYDDTLRAMRPYLDVNEFYNCPLRQEVDYAIARDDDPHVLYAGYAFWYGWRYFTEGGGMQKLGQRFMWDKQRFSVLASDVDVVWDGGYINSSHPDADGLLASRVVQGAPAGLAGVQAKETWSFYVTGAQARRGPVDRNFLYTDQSVERMNGLIMEDDRVTAVPNSSYGNGFIPYRTWLPAR